MYYVKLVMLTIKPRLAYRNSVKINILCLLGKTKLLFNLR